MTRHYRQHQKGEKTSTNTIASIFAWSRGPAFRAKLDNNDTLLQFCHKLEKVCVDTLKAGQITKDLALCIYGPALKESHYLTTEGFLHTLRGNLEKAKT